MNLTEADLNAIADRVIERLVDRFAGRPMLVRHIVPDEKFCEGQLETFLSTEHERPEPARYGVKDCTRCGELKGPTAFWRNSRVCRKCTKALSPATKPEPECAPATTAAPQEVDDEPTPVLSGRKCLLCGKGGVEAGQRYCPPCTEEAAAMRGRKGDDEDEGDGDVAA